MAVWKCFMVLHDPQVKSRLLNPFSNLTQAVSSVTLFPPNLDTCTVVPRSPGLSPHGPLDSLVHSFIYVVLSSQNFFLPLSANASKLFKKQVKHHLVSDVLPIPTGKSVIILGSHISWTWPCTPDHRVLTLASGTSRLKIYLCILIFKPEEKALLLITWLMRNWRAEKLNNVPSFRPTVVCVTVIWKQGMWAHSSPF